MSNIIFRISDKSITVIINGRVRTTNARSANYSALKVALYADPQDLDVIKSLSDIPAFLALETHGRVSVSGDEVRFDDIPIKSVLTKRILEHLKAGISITPLANFLDRMMQNPNSDIHEDLYAWCEEGELPFTEDGFLIAYKKVQDDYYSLYKGDRGRVLYNINTIVEVPVEEVDPDRDNECSNGLHFCSYGYLKFYSGRSGRVLIVKIDPADVVAIPVDHSRQKGRTFRMEIIDEIAADEVGDAFKGRLVVSNQGTYNADEESTATTSSYANNCLAYGGTNEPITEGRLRGLLAHGGILYAAHILDQTEQQITEWVHSIDFPTASLGTLSGAPAVTAPAPASAQNEAPAPVLVSADLEVPELVFERGGLLYSRQTIIDGVAENGIRGFTRLRNVPRSTVYGWLKKIEGFEAGTTFSHGGVQYSIEAIAQAANAYSITAVSRVTNIPQSTLRGWLKKT